MLNNNNRAGCGYGPSLETHMHFLGCHPHGHLSPPLLFPITSCFLHRAAAGQSTRSRKQTPSELMQGVYICSFSSDTAEAKGAPFGCGAKE